MRSELRLRLAATERAAVAVTLICGFSYGYWVGAVFAGVFTGILCFALLQLCAALTRKRREHLDDPKDGE